MCIYNGCPFRISLYFQYTVQKKEDDGFAWQTIPCKQGRIVLDGVNAGRDDIEWQFTFVLQLTTIFRSFPQLACLFWVKLTPSLSASVHTRSPRWHVCMFVGAPVCTADWQIGLLECEDLVNNDTFCSCRDKALQHESPASGVIQMWDFWHRQTWRKSPVLDNAYTKRCVSWESPVC